MSDLPPDKEAEATNKTFSEAEKQPGNAPEESDAQPSADRAPAGPAAPAEPGKRAIRIANIALGIALASAISYVFFSFQLDRIPLIKGIAIAWAALLAALYKLKPGRRLTAAMMVFPAVIAVYGMEAKLASSRPPPANASAQRGVEFDTRALWEAITEERAEGRDAWPSIQPKALLVLHFKDGGIAEDEISLHTLSEEWGVTVGPNQERVLPLGGLSNARIVFCNEGGRFAIYESDEHGFNNPRGLWAKETADIVIAGDSFSQAACVNANEAPAHYIREKYPVTLNLAMAGSGPMLELASLEEYAAPKKPKTVLWVYYNNDIADLDVEKKVPLLEKYLEGGFTQRLMDRQAEVDEGIKALAGKIEKVSRRYPGWLTSMGLGRHGAPVWFQDLVMKESRSAGAAVMRLDRLSWAVTSRAAANYFHEPPDVPMFRKTLERARDRVRSWGGEMVFVYMADMFYLQFKGKQSNPNREMVLSTVKELGIPLIDLHPAFLAVEDPNTIRYNPESHCNPEGYKLAAEVILKGLKDMGR